jgi:hypothetical protein
MSESRDWLLPLVHLTPYFTYQALRAVAAMGRKRGDSCCTFATSFAGSTTTVSAAFPLSLLFLATFVEPDDEFAHAATCCDVDQDM